MHRLGLGAEGALPVSAASGDGMADLYVALQPHIDAAVEQLQGRVKEGRAAAATGDAPAAPRAGRAHGSSMEGLGWNEDVHEGAEADGAATQQDEDLELEGQEEEEGSGHEEAKLCEAGSVLPAGPLRLAIMGQPNAGKSTLMNRLLGWQRSLTGG